MLSNLPRLGSSTGSETEGAERGLPISVPSDYIPQCLVKNEFVTPSPLRSPNADDSPSSQPPQAKKVAEKTREMALLAAQAWADTRLVPAGYTLIGAERESGFDFLYCTPDEEIAIIDSLAGDEQLASIRSSDGTIAEQGSLAYLLSVLEKAESTAPELTERIRMALARGRLRYFEVRQPIAESGELGQCEVRQFAL